MPETTKPASVPAGVHRLWRLVAMGLIVGIALHALWTRQTTAPATAAVLTVRGDPLPPPDPRLDQMLEAVDFDNAHFADVLGNLTDRTGINLVVAWDTLHKAGMDRESPVTLHLKHVSLATALDAVLLCVDKAHAVSWNEFGGIVHVTTFESEDHNHLLMRFYDVHRLIEKGYPYEKNSSLTNYPSPTERLGWLAKVVSYNVHSATWKDNGGDVGSIAVYPPGTLLIIQTTQVHRHIETFLRKLEQTH
jgi:hypothetical protein